MVRHVRDGAGAPGKFVKLKCKVMSKKKKENGKMAEGFSTSEKVDFTVFKDGTLSRETIRSWLSTDIRGVYMILAEVLAAEEVLDALTDVFYKRYKKLHEAKMAQTELPLK